MRVEKMSHVRTCTRTDDSTENVLSVGLSVAP